MLIRPSAVLYAQIAPRHCYSYPCDKSDLMVTPYGKIVSTERGHTVTASPHLVQGHSLYCSSVQPMSRKRQTWLVIFENVWVRISLAVTLRREQHPYLGLVRRHCPFAILAYCSSTVRARRNMRSDGNLDSSARASYSISMHVSRFVVRDGRAHSIALCRTGAATRCCCYCCCYCYWWHRRGRHFAWWRSLRARPIH